MAANDKSRISLVVNNPIKPSGDYIPPKGTQLHLALFDEAETVETANDTMKRSPGILSLANKVNGNLVMQRMMKAAMEKVKAKAPHESD